MGNIIWTREWSSSDNGTTLNGSDIQNIQNDIVTVINSGLSDSNVSASAAIAESKVAFDVSAGHTHDDSDSNAFPLTNHSDVVISSVSDGQVISYSNANSRWENISPSTPTGVILLWTTDTAPTGFILCDGAEISRSTYAILFAVIGEIYGAGDGSSTFLIPDLRGRVVLCQDDMGGISADRVTNVQADSLNGSAGDEDGISAHTHQMKDSENGSVDGPYRAGSGQVWARLLRETLLGDTGSKYPLWGTQSAGTSGGNLPPYITLNYIIKT